MIIKSNHLKLLWLHPQDLLISIKFSGVSPYTIICHKKLIEE